MNYAAKVHPGPGQYAVSVKTENSFGHTTQCTLSLDGPDGPLAKTILCADDLDALISSLKAARKYVIAHR